MTAVYLLDTDVLIDIQRGYAPALAWFSNLAELPRVSGFTVMELIQDAPSAQHLRQAMKLVSPLPVIWPTEAECGRALADFATYHLSHGLGLLDALIAACVIGRAATLCTFNVKHYAAVPGLATAQPYVR
jgi:predicted nucleic acid-binding protein